jgi:CHAT domain
MSSPEQIRRQIDDLVKKRADAEKRVGDARAKQAKKEAEAASNRSRAERTPSATTARSYLRSAKSAEKQAIAEGNKGADESKKIAALTKKEADLSKALSSALEKQRREEARTRRRQAAEDASARKRLEDAERRARERERQAERARTDALVSATEDRLSHQIAQLRPPQIERLRILYVTAAPEADLRVDKEIRRVKRGVKSATHRDLVTIEHLSAATASDLLDGLSGLRPHVVHFAGHANESVLIFDTEADDDNPGHEISSDLFARAVGAVDEPPILVVLNACESEAHLGTLVEVVPVAIGMSAEIGDRDAMSFAARFYTAIADGQSVSSAYEAARVQMEFDGMPDADLPVLNAREGVDPAAVALVIPPE